MNNRRNFKISDSIPLISSVSLGMIFILIDLLSYGRNYLYIQSNDQELEEISITMHLFSTIIAQIVSNFFTNIKSGLMFGGIVESYVYTREIHKSNVLMLNNARMALANTFLCLFLSVILLSSFFAVLKFFNFGYIFKFLPKAPLVGIFGAVGLYQLNIGYEQLTKKLVPGSYITKFLLIGSVLAILAFILEKKFESVVYILPLYVFIVVISFYLIFILILNVDLNSLIENKWLQQKYSINLNPRKLLKYFDFKLIKLKIIIRNIPNILKLTLFCFIMFPINLSIFSHQMNLTIDYDRELKAQAIGNLFNSMFFLPTYLICTYSIFFRKSGGTSKAYSVALGFCLILLIFLFPIINPYIPFIVLGMIPLTVGITIINNVFYKNIFVISTIDYLIIIVTAISCYYFGSLFALFIGTFIELIRYVKILRDEKNFKFEIKTQIQKERELYINDIVKRNNITVIKIDYVLIFITLYRYFSVIKGMQDNDFIKYVILDFSECFFVDWVSIDYIKESLQEINNITEHIIIINPSKNLEDIVKYRDIYHKNIFVKNYEEAAEKIKNLEIYYRIENLNYKNLDYK